MIWTFADQTLHFTTSATGVVALTPVAEMILAPRASIATTFRGIFGLGAFVTGTKDLFKRTPNLSKASAISTAGIANPPRFGLPSPFALANVTTAGRTGAFCAAFATTFGVTLWKEILTVDLQRDLRFKDVVFTLDFQKKSKTKGGTVSNKQTAFKITNNIHIFLNSSRDPKISKIYPLVN
jgi:hypothetical protein